MDAKPYRPLRSMRTFSDENSHPEGPLPKTIHHRNKSSPALSSIANGAGFKNAAKRTAFGDVSNTAGQTRVLKDDAAQPIKPTQTAPKLSHTITERRSTAFLKPAQRPLSVASLRSLLTGSHTNESHVPVESQHQPPTHDILPPLQTANTRKLLTKRNTTIFRDISLDTVKEIDNADPEKQIALPVGQCSEESIPSDVASIEHNPQIHLPAPSVTTISEPVKAPHQLIIPTSSALPDHNYTSDMPTSIDDYSLVKSQSEVKIASPAQQSTPPEEEIYIQQATAGAEVPVLTAIKQTETQISLPPLEQVVGTHAFASLQQQHMQLPTPTEPEEFWPEEEEGYDEEGYVTARSFRSRSDNTTGGATTVLVPRMNQRARREIEAATKVVEATRTVEEIEDENFDTSMVAEYGDEIFEYMRQLEVKMSPNPHYMDNQHEIQWSMRSVLMDWLVQVHHRFNLLPETLFLCVNYIDRFLSSKVVSLGKLQLVGATAIFIAAKYEEINCPSVQEIVYMVDGGYSIDEILKAERFMLTMLQFELGWPGPMSFLRRISKADDYDLETRTLAKYFLEVTLMDERFIGSPPSFAAAASHCLARLMLRKGSWSPHHVYYSGYTYTQLKPLVQLLLECCEDPLKHHRAVYDKYCDKRYKRASVFVQNEVQRGFHLPEPPSMKPYPQSPTYAYYNNTPYFGA